MAVVERILNNIMPQRTKGSKRHSKGKKAGGNGDNWKNKAAFDIEEVDSVADIKVKPLFLGTDHHDDYFPKVSPYETIGLETPSTSETATIKASSTKKLNVCLKSTFKETLGLENPVSDVGIDQIDPIEGLVTLEKDQDNFIIAQDFNPSRNFTFDRPTASKRSIANTLDFKFTVNPNFSNATKTPMSIFKTQNRKQFSDVGTTKRRKSEKLDNSRTISAKAILRMVDYSLVSDVEFTSMSMSECNTPTKHCSVLISDEDLMQAKRLVF